MTDQERLEQIQEESITDAIEYGCTHGSRSQVKTDRIVKDVKWLIEQAERTQSVEEENARLRMQYENTGAVMNRMQARSLHEENQRLRKALEFYADEENYTRSLGDYETGYPEEVLMDRGNKAKTALEGEG